MRYRFLMSNNLIIRRYAWPYLHVNFATTREGSVHASCEFTLSMDAHVSCARAQRAWGGRSSRVPCCLLHVRTDT
jgi:hypothetical protein